jgi:sugar/nucleoside kinase (ribokinase family)
VDSGTLVAHPTEPTAITVAVSTASDRVFYTYAAANGLLALLLNSSDTRAQLAQARHVHFAHLMEPDLLLELTEWLHAQRCTVSIDVGWNQAWLTNPAGLRALAEVDWFFPNESEAALITGMALNPKPDARRTLQWFAEHGLSRVALKLGSQGSAAIKGAAIEEAAIEVNDIVLASPLQSVVPIDTTGAGDCFDAGFLAAWLEGKNLHECLAWGNVCGALSTRCAGGIEGFPSRAEVEAELKRV